MEPIEEKDLDMENKFSEKTEKNSQETISSLEIKPERKEGAAEKDDSYAKILSKLKTQTVAADDDAVKNDAEATSQEKDAEAKINMLINLAQQKGVIHAVKVARHLEDSYTLDEFHDRLLADELHDALVAKGLIKEL